MNSDELTVFVDRLRSLYPDAYVPQFEWNSGRLNARVLFLFEKPGPMTDPKNGGSGFISIDNDDPTARATKQFLAGAGLNRNDIVLWNTIPLWNKTRRITRAERKLGVIHLRELLQILVNLKVIVLVGNHAKDIRKHLDESIYKVFSSSHPSPIVRARYPERWKNIQNEWKQVAEYLSSLR